MCIFEIPRGRDIRIRGVRSENVRDVTAQKLSPDCIRLDSLTYPEFWVEIRVDFMESRGRFSDELFANGANDFPRSRWLVRDREIEVCSRGREVVIVVSVELR